jgi:hypothetical protein
MLWTWWQGDYLSGIGPLRGMHIAVAGAPGEIARLNGISLEEAGRRMAGGDRAHCECVAPAA